MVCVFVGSGCWTSWLDKAVSGEREGKRGRSVGSTGDMGRGERKATVGNLLQSWRRDWKIGSGEQREKMGSVDTLPGFLAGEAVG